MRTSFAALFLIAITSLPAACSRDDNPHALKQTIPTYSGGAAGASAAAATGPAGQAKEIFSLRCTPCHGPEGRGDGPASASLTPHPRNFHDLAWQKQASDDHIAKIIQYGGVAVGKSPAMPANPDLGDKPEIVAALKDHIRGLAQ
jgi:cytochrome c551/c552